MHWIKKGLLFEPKGDLAWMRTHASIPCVEHLRENLYRVYCYGRDELNRSQVGFFELNMDMPQHILYLTEKPVLGLGELGTFDDSGVMPACVINFKDKRFLYYTGWTRGVTVPFYFYIGLAISTDNGKTFVRFSEAPVLGRSKIDPFLTASPSVLIENGIWRMWYVSGARWGYENNQPKHYYHIRYAESKDGFQWVPTGHVCIDFKNSNEYAIARPFVIYENKIYKMWYSFRGVSYRIGYAESWDGLHWSRLDEKAGIDASAEGWDSQMVAYPVVFQHKNKKFMLYNGNGYGKTGIGLAILEEGT